MRQPQTGDVPLVSWPCRALWVAPHRPADPAEFLARLPGECRRVRQHGAGAMEFHADACVLDERYAQPALWREVAGILAAEGLAATVHLPYLWTDLAALDGPVWEGSVRAVAAAARATAPLAPRVAAVHPANYATQALVLHTPAAEQPALLEALAQRLVAALRRLAAEAGPALALENLEGLPFALYLSLCREAGVGACLDVGHALSDGDDPAGAVTALAGRLVGLHLHDAVPPQPPALRASSAGAPGGRTPGPAAGQGPGKAGAQDRAATSPFLPAAGAGRAHLPLGAGRLDLPGLLQALRAAGFRGPVVLEVEGTGEELARSAAAFLRAAGVR